MSGYLPYGFVYPEGFDYNKSNPDPMIEQLRLRMEYLNRALDHSTQPEHLFVAALNKLQSHSAFDKDVFWEIMRTTASPEQLASLAEAVIDQVSDALPRLELPNTIALFDCRFVATKEWEHIRRYSIGGSEAAAVLGLSHYQSPRSLYYEKKSPTRKPRDISGQQILDYGHFLEDYVVQTNAKAMGAMVYPEFRMFAHKDHPYITCNPDSIFLMPDRRLALFEAKTAFRMKRDEWKAGIPDYYEPQPRQYLEVLNDLRLNDGFIGVCLGGDPADMLSHSYERDFTKGAEQVQKIAEYWHNYIVPGILPPLCGDVEMDMEAVYGYRTPSPLASKTPFALPVEAAQDFARYFEIQEERKQLSKQVSAAKATEQSLYNAIQDSLPAELTVCTRENDVSYVLRAEEKSTQSYDHAAASAIIPNSIMHELNRLAAAVKESGLSNGIPKVTKKVSKAAKTKGVA